MQYTSYVQMASNSYSPWNANAAYGMPMAGMPMSLPAYGCPLAMGLPDVDFGLTPQVQQQMNLLGYQGLAEQKQPRIIGMPKSNKREKQAAVVVSSPPGLEKVDVECDGDCSDISAGKDSLEAGPRCTVMLRNLPNSYTRVMLIQLLDSEGFAGKYDFVYFPIDFKSRLSLAYAFINLVSAKETQRFWKHFHGFSKWAVPSHKAARVNWSEFQGLAANIERYRNSPIMHEAVPDEYKPVLFSDASRVPFPAPTEKVRAPRRRIHAKAVQPGRLA